MKKLLSLLLVGTLLAGCGGEQSAVDSNDTDDNESALAPPVADPAKVPVVDPAKVPFVEKWAEWEANPEPYGGLEALAKIREAKEKGSPKSIWSSGKRVSLDLSGKKVTDLTPLTGLTNLTNLTLSGNQITDLTPLAGLANLLLLALDHNQIADLTPLKGLTNLKMLALQENPLTADQLAMLKKALPRCNVFF